MAGNLFKQRVSSSPNQKRGTMPDGAVSLFLIVVAGTLEAHS